MGSEFMKGALRALRAASDFLNRIAIAALLSVFYVVCIGLSAALFRVGALLRKTRRETFWTAPEEGESDTGQFRSAY